MKVLITGADGFIGRHLVLVLAMDGVWVDGVTRNPEPIRSIKHDLRAPFSPYVIEHLKSQEFTHIVHAAAEVGGARSLSDPAAAVESIVLGDLHTLELARALKVERFVYLSSADVLGECAADKDESAPLAPRSPYAAAKGSGEELARVYAKAGWVPAVIARLGSVFGEGQRGPRMIPRVMEQARQTPARITCYKGCERNWIHVNECVGYLRVLLERGTPGQTYHIAGPLLSNESVIDELVDSIAIKMGVQFADPPPAYVKRSSLVDTKLGISRCDHEVRRQLREVGRWYGRSG